MVTQQEAEELARKSIQEYLKSCNPVTVKDAGNALMKLFSVAGVTMVSAVGYEEAVARMLGTADFIAKSMRVEQFKSERPN